MDDLKPRDYGEEIAQFRAEIIGGLARCELEHGELAEELEKLSNKRFRPPRSKATRTYSVPTLQRWLYAYKKGGLAALRPPGRKDKGRGRRLNEEQLKLMLDIRREHPSASSRLIVRTLEMCGVLQKGQLSPVTLRRIYADHNLPRKSAREADLDHLRLRWQAEYPHAMWHGDVCHLAPIEIAGAKQPVRVHALLDDYSRDVLAIRAYHTEREVDMLDLLVRALRRHGVPDALYLDNGSTYRGDTLRIACARLEVTLIHARPYKPQARGKMERFWRSLREGCTDFIGRVASLHDINVRLFAFVEEHYRRSPHAGLLGRTPMAAVEDASNRERCAIDEDRLREALTVRRRRRLRADNTLGILGTDYEVRQSFLAKKTVTVGYCVIDQPSEPWVEHQDERYPLLPVDPVKNGKSRKRPRQKTDEPNKPTTSFDPPGALLDEARARIRNAVESRKETPDENR